MLRRWAARFAFVTSKACAYCGATGGLTKEHLLARSLMERTVGNDMFLEAAKRFVGGQPTIRDVCATCNNGVLSTLDAYGARLFDRFFAKVHRAGEDVRFSYEFDLLARWLMKVAFNVARASKTQSDIDVLSEFREYVISSGPPGRFAVFLVLFGPEPIPQHLRDKVPEPFRSSGELPPFDIRNARCEDPRLVPKFSCVRLVAVHAYYFFLVFGHQATPRGEWRRDLEFFETLFDRVKRVRVHETVAKVRVSRDKWTELKQASVLANLDAYWERYGWDDSEAPA